VAVLEQLTAEDLYSILKNQKNPVINAKKADFRAYGIDIRFEDEALRLLAEQAHEERTGARGLVSVLEKAVLPFEKKLPSTDISFFLVTPEAVKNPKAELERFLAAGDGADFRDRYDKAWQEDKEAAIRSLSSREEYYREHYSEALTEARIELAVTWHLRSGLDLEEIFQEVVTMIAEVRRFESDFLTKHQISLSFSDEAVDEILRLATAEDTNAEAICRRVSRDYDYALKLVMDKTGQREFAVTREAILDPETFINETIRSSYRTGPFAIPGRTKD
jgi:ATP-dependent Clp protease ATP-binding subunit ClpX